MTDPAPTDTAVEFPEDGLAVVPTLAGFQHLTERVEALEGQVPATVPAEEDGDPVTLATLNDRLSRHRAELEAIKTWCKGVSRFLGLPTSTTPTTPPTTTTGTFQ